MESLGWTNQEWRSFRRLRRKYKVSVAFLKFNVENINRFLLYVTAPRFRLKRVAERRKRGRVVLLHNCFTRMIFDPHRFKVIKERKRNVKKWSSSVVAHLRKSIAPVEFVESTYFYNKADVATAEPEDVRKQMKEQLELLKSGKRVVPLITGTISPVAEDSKDEQLEASEAGGDTAIEDLPDDISVEGLRVEGVVTANTEKDSTAIPGCSLEANGTNQIIPKEPKTFIQRVLESEPPQGGKPINGLKVAKPAESKGNESKEGREERDTTEEATTKQTGIAPETSPPKEQTSGRPTNSTVASGDEADSLLTPIPPPAGGSKGDKVSFLDMLMTKVGLPSNQLHPETSSAVVQVRNEPLVDSADDDAQICDFEESQKPGMLLTPIVPQRSKSKGANAAFVSESLNEYMRENLLNSKTESDDESSPVAKRKHRQANLYGLVTPDCRPPFMEMPVVPERLQKLRTVAERRTYLQKFSKNQKLAIINNEAMIYRELQRRVQHKQHKAKLCSQAIQQSLNSRMPFTREGWQAVNFLTTDYNNYYYQVIRVDGEEDPVRLPGVRGNNDAPEKRPYRSRWLAAKSTRPGGCPPTCVDALLNLKPIKSAKRHNKLNHCAMPALCKPCPLSHKPFQRPLDEETAALLLAGGSMAVVRMPLVELEVFPELGKPLPEMAKRYLQYILPHQDITREWAEFSVSTLNSPPKTMREAELVAAAAVAKGGRRQSFTFAIPYLNDRNHILVRRVIDRSEKLDESFQDAAADTVAGLRFREKLPLGDALGLECADILTEMINSVAISCSENSFVKDDPDGVSEATTGSGKRADSLKLLGRSEMPKAEAKSRKQSRLLCELKRLNATIIDAAVLSEPVESKPCLREYCALGCVCQSLAEDRKPRTHCGKPKCIFECSCKGSGMSRVMRLESDGRSITTEDAFNLRRKATARLARMEKEFTSTVVLTGNETLLINESQYDKKRRCTKMPKRYEDGEDFAEDTRLNHSSASPSPGKGVKSGSVVTIDSEVASASGGASSCGMVMAEIAPVQYNEPVFVREEILDQLKHCTVDVVRFADCKNMEPFCMVHELYKCFCNGRALEGKPLVIEKEEKGETIKSEGANDPVAGGEEEWSEAPAKQTRGRYSFQQVEDRVPTPIFRTPPRPGLDESEKAEAAAEESFANLSVGCTVDVSGSASFVACDPLPVGSEAPDDEIPVENCASGGEEGGDCDYLADDSLLEVPKKPTTETVSRGRRRIHPPKPSAEEQVVINGFYGSQPSGCRRVVAVPRNVYTRLNRKRATCVVTQMHQLEGSKTKKLLDEHISRSAYCHKNELERSKKERDEQQQQQRQLLWQQQQERQQERQLERQERLEKQERVYEKLLERQSEKPLEKRQPVKQEKRQGGDKAGIRVKQWKDLQQTTTIKQEPPEEGEEEESPLANAMYEESSNSLDSADPSAARKRPYVEAPRKSWWKRKRGQGLQEGVAEGECDSQLLPGDTANDFMETSETAPETTPIKMPRIASCFSLRDLGAGSMMANLPPSLKPSALEVLVPEPQPKAANKVVAPRSETPPFQDFYNGVIKNINTLVTKKMHDIDVALKRESLVVPAPSSDNLCIIRWSNFCSAFRERFVYIWDVRMHDGNYLAATVRNVMPMVPNALGVVNIAAAQPQQLPVMAHFLLGLMRVKPSEKLAVVMQGRCTYWKVKGFLRQQPENACARPTPKTHPKLARKINVLCDLLVKQRVAEHRKSMAAATAAPAVQPSGGIVLAAAPVAAKSPLPVNSISVVASSSPAAGPSLLEKNVLMQHRKSLTASGGSGAGAPVVRSVTICNKKAPIKLANSSTSAGRVTIPAVTTPQPQPQQIFLQQQHHNQPVKEQHHPQTVKDVPPSPIMPKECPQLKTNILIRKVRRSDLEDIVQPEQHSEDHRWLVLDLRRDFTHIFVPDFKDLVSLDRIRKVMSLSQVKAKIVKLQFFQNAPYDAFVTPNSQTKLYFGPLKLNMRPPTLILMRRIGNQMLLREVYHQEPRSKVEGGGGAAGETTAFWMLQIKNQIKYEFESGDEEVDEEEEGEAPQADAATTFVASLSEEEAAAPPTTTSTSNESDDEDDCFIVDEVDESDGEEEEKEEMAEPPPPPPQGVQSITIQRSPKSNKLQVTFNKPASDDAASAPVLQLKDFNLPSTTSVTQVPRDNAADSEPAGFQPLFGGSAPIAADRESAQKKPPTFLNAEVEMIPVSDELDETEPNQGNEKDSEAKARAGDEKAALKRRIPTAAASQKLEAKRRRIVLSNDFGFQVWPQVNAVAAVPDSPKKLSDDPKAKPPMIQKPFRVGAKRRSASPSPSLAASEAATKAKKPLLNPPQPQRKASVCVAGREKPQIGPIRLAQPEAKRISVGSEQKDALPAGETERRRSGDLSGAMQKVSIGLEDGSVGSSSTAPAASVVNPNRGPANGIVPLTAAHSSVVAVLNAPVVAAAPTKKLPIMLRKAQRMPSAAAQLVATGPSGAAPAAAGHAPRLSLDSNVKKPIFNIKHAARPSMPSKLKLVGPATIAGGNVVNGKIVIGNGVASKAAGDGAVNKIVIKGDGSLEIPVKMRVSAQNPKQLHDSPQVVRPMSGSNPPKLVPLLPKPPQLELQQLLQQKKPPGQPKGGGDQVDYGYFVSSIMGGPRFVAKRIRSEFIIKIPYTGGIMQLSGMPNVNCSLNDLMYKHEPHLIEQLPCSWRFQAHDRLKAKAALISEQKNPAATSKQASLLGPAPQPPKVSIGKASATSTATTSSAPSQAASGSVKVVPLKTASVAPPAVAAIAKPNIQKTVIMGDSKNNYTIISSKSGMAAPAAVVAAKSQLAAVAPQTTSSNPTKVAIGNNVGPVKITSSPPAAVPRDAITNMKKDMRKEVTAITGQAMAKKNGGSNTVIDID